MAVKKNTKTNSKKKVTKAQIAQIKKQRLLLKIGSGLASGYSCEALEDINIELINNNADIKDTLLVTFIDPKTGDPAEQWKLTLVKKSKMWMYGEDYLEEDVKVTFNEGYDYKTSNKTDTESKENNDTGNNDTKVEENATTDDDDTEKHE